MEELLEILRCRLSIADKVGTENCNFGNIRKFLKVAAVLVLNTPDDGRLLPNHVE